MGNSLSSNEKVLFYAIQENNEMMIDQMLKQYPEMANANLLKGATNPICRATYCNHQSIVLMLLQHGADINSKASNGRTPLMWAAFRGNIILIELLITKGADLAAEDKEGLNCFDIAVIRMQYEAAHYLYKHHGMTRSETERVSLYYPDEKQECGTGKMFREEFDVDLFFLFMEQDRETVDDREVFFEKKRREYAEWIASDLVVDTRESWKDWLSRQTQFGEVPLIPRAQLPEEFQPHFSFYNKMVNIANGIDPTPRGERERRQNNPADMEDQAAQSQVDAKIKADGVHSQQVLPEAPSADLREERKGVEMSDIKEKAPVQGTMIMQEEVVDDLGFDDPNQFADMKDYTDQSQVAGQEEEVDMDYSSTNMIPADNKDVEGEDILGRPETALN